MGFVPVLILLIDIYSSELFLKNLILIDLIGLHFLGFIKLQLEHKVLFQLLQMLALDYLYHQILKCNFQTKSKQD